MWGGTDDDGFGTTWKDRSLVTFDLRSIPANATVTSAKLQLFAEGLPLPANATVEAHRVTTSWKEGTGGSPSTPTFCMGDGATWLETDGTTKWQTPGGDFDPAIAASVQHTTTDSVN